MSDLGSRLLKLGELGPELEERELSQDEVRALVSEYLTIFLGESPELTSSTAQFLSYSSLSFLIKDERMGEIHKLYSILEPDHADIGPGDVPEEFRAFYERMIKFAPRNRVSYNDYGISNSDTFWVPSSGFCATLDPHDISMPWALSEKEIEHYRSGFRPEVPEFLTPRGINKLNIGNLTIAATSLLIGQKKGHLRELLLNVDTEERVQNIAMTILQGILFEEDFNPEFLERNSDKAIYCVKELAGPKTCQNHHDTLVSKWRGAYRS